MAQKNAACFAAGGPPQHRGPDDSVVLAEADSFLRPRFSRGGRLHGPGQLGDGSLRRREVRLRAAHGRHDLQFHGDLASAFVHQAWRRHWPRPRPSVSRSLFDADRVVALDSLRNRYHRMRPGGSRRLRHRLQLLFGLPLVWGCIITALDVLAVLYLQTKGFRYIEALVITLIVTIGSCFAAELIFSKPNLTGVMLGFVPGPRIVVNQEMLYVSIGILGATVMPHNLYLHSSIVQTRKFEQTPEGKREAIKFATIDSSVALMFALFINAAILILSAAVFHWSGQQEVAEIQDAYKLLSPLLGVGVASALFAVALLASGQNSTLTGTLAGQIVMEGFLNFRITPWLRRLITRLIAIVPAVFIIGIFGEGKTTELLVASQVVLSMQLGFAVWPLMRFTGEKAKMGEFANRLWVKILGWTAAGVIIVLNVKLLLDTFLPASVLNALYSFIGLPAPK